MTKKYLEANLTLTRLKRTWVIVDENDCILTDVITESDADFILQMQKTAIEKSGIPIELTTVDQLKIGDKFIFCENPSLTQYTFIESSKSDGGQIMILFRPVVFPAFRKWMVVVRTNYVVCKIKENEQNEQV